ncbi:GerMN domain-containing protein, partial [Candidatus Dojkabacteria bacterium]|nr:GerMN domain-containing protein [Candidatus Dojkabacteria bacterium]
NINDGVEILSLSISKGVAYVDLSNELQEGVGGSCKVTSIRAQITETLKQFSTVDSVVISIEGESEDILQP